MVMECRDTGYERSFLMKSAHNSLEMHYGADSLYCSRSRGVRKSSGVFCLYSPLILLFNTDLSDNDWRDCPFKE